jgi:acyl-CoA synthetase (AMP-forming)/AMP-acid ligase II
MRLHDALLFHARERPDAEFARQGARRLSYAEARDAACRLARALVAAGVRPGQRVALLAKNCLEYPLCYYGASLAGAALVPVNVRLAPPEIAQVLADSEAAIIIAGAEYTATIDQLAARLPALRRRVALAETTPAGWQPFAEWIAAQPAEPPEIPVTDDFDLYQLYTSGTTGRPKGAVLTQGAVTQNLAQIQIGLGLRRGERSLVVAPLFHASAVYTTFATVQAGGSLVIHEAFDPPRVLRSLREDRITFATLVAAMLLACLNTAGTEPATFPELRLILYGASPIAAETLRRALAFFGCDFVQAYGLTEATVAVSFLSPADHALALRERPELLLSAGRAVAGTEIRVVDAAGRALPPGETGEIAVRGPQLMRGYWRLPEATAETLRGGWLHTGDAGMLDAEGYLYVQDRLKDMIVSGGENIYPREVEDALMQHPAVADAAVIGVPNARWGETVKAILVCRDGVAADGALAEAIIAFCRERLAGYKLPRSVEFVESLPRNPSGKVLKRELREPYWAGQARRVAGV